jgi:hypothetical protein
MLQHRIYGGFRGNFERVLKMKQYIGTKVIKAKPMTRDAAEALLKRDVGGKKTGDGYLVEYQDGYQSWSPKDVFEEAYTEYPASGVPLGLASTATTVK